MKKQGQDKQDLIVRLNCDITTVPLKTILTAL